MTPSLVQDRSKVPEATALFWVLKILSTGMGETTSDFFARSFDPVIVVGVTGLALLASMALQLTTSRLVLWVYWLNVLLVSVFGTMAADVLHVGLGVPYAASTMLFLVLLLVIFALWFGIDRSLSIPSITTRRRELFYWAAVFTTFALGTAGGDWTATSLALGYSGSGLIFTLAFLLPFVAFWFIPRGQGTTFWLAYILTRPLGASWADFAGVPEARGGLNWGTGPVSLALFVVFLGLVLLASKQATHRTPPN